MAFGTLERHRSNPQAITCHKSQLVICSFHLSFLINHRYNLEIVVTASSTSDDWQWADFEPPQKNRNPSCHYIFQSQCPKYIKISAVHSEIGFSTLSLVPASLCLSFQSRCLYLICFNISYHCSLPPVEGIPCTTISSTIPTTIPQSLILTPKTQQSIRHKSQPNYLIIMKREDGPVCKIIPSIARAS